MKKLAILMLWVVLLTGCASQPGDETPAEGVSQSDRERYTKVVDQTLYDTYWRYSADSLEFVQGVVPEKKEENEGAFLASQDMGYPMETHAGKPAVAATVNLLHYNGEAAGRAYFYFIRGAIAGVYYSGGYKGDAHSLKERNLYLADGAFQKYETAAVDAGAYLSQETSFPPDGFEGAAINDRNQFYVAAIEMGNVVIYRYNQGFTRNRTLYFTNGDLEATSAAIVNTEDGNLLAVLISNVQEGSLTEGAGDKVYSVKVVFYNERFQKWGEMPLESEHVTSLAADGSQLVLANSQTMEYYEVTENEFEKTNQYFLDHGVLDFHVADLDGDGVKEYILTDEQDLYLYHKNQSSFVKLWSTHLGIPSLSGNIYTGDLNQDGVKEIYISDTTGTMIRYTLTPSGLRSRNSDVEYGDRIYPFDLDGDGLDDFIRLNDVEGLQCTLYTADMPEGE